MPLDVTFPLQALPDPLGLEHRPFVALVDNVMPDAECAHWIAHMEAVGPTLASVNHGSYQAIEPEVRNNDRVIFDDTALAQELWGRLRAVVPAALPERHARLWTDRLMTPVGLNERFRGYRYGTGQFFAPHFDGSFARNEHERSLITVLFYLNEGCVGGETALLDFDLRVAPRRGSALLFEHMIYHSGEELRRGSKYVLRSDVMFRAAA